MPINKDLNHIVRDNNSSKNDESMLTLSPSPDPSGRTTNLNSFNLDSNYQFNFGFQNPGGSNANPENVQKYNQISNATLNLSPTGDQAPKPRVVNNVLKSSFIRKHDYSRNSSEER